MMKSYALILRIIVIVLCLFICNTQAFDLFDPERGKEKVVTPPPAPVPTPVKPLTPPPAPVAPPKPPPPQQDFTLRGVSRIGKKQSAILQAPDGKEFIQPLTNGTRTPLKGYSNYALLKVDAHEILLEYPEDSPCRASNEQKGIRCKDNGKTATLLLARRNPLAPPPPPPPPVQPPPPPAQPPVMTEEQKKREEEELKKRQEIYKNFQRQTIKDEDVPPGMRVVRTPFGDRLVPNTPQ